MKPFIVNFPADVTNSICLIQNVVAATPMTINGPLASPIYSTIPPFTSSPGVVLSGIKRNVSVSSANNIAGVNFVVVGKRDGFTVNDTIMGVNNDTVQGTTLFDTILSITPNANANGVLVGTGIIGRTNWFLSDYNIGVANLTTSVTLTAAGTYSFKTTLQDVGSVAPDSIISFTPVTSLSAATANAIGTYNGAARYSCVDLTAGTVGGTMQVIFLQQGLNS